ncbi:MAG: ABC transporter permease subunit [Paracoccaceae bacterium]|nr:ABC transporter permease subunit [Paracoccaceae bacterium]
MFDKERWQRLTLWDWIVQLALVALVVVIVWGAIESARVNLAALGVTSGFWFLDRSTGWSYSFALIEQSIDDSYARTLLIGFLNTLLVGLISIVFATIVGFIIGTARDSRNLGLQTFAGTFVQTFRNIPLILQIVFLYSILIHLPGPKQSLTVLDLAFMSNRGLMLPTPDLPGFAIVLGLAAAVGLGVAVRRHVDGVLRGLALGFGGTVLALALVALAFGPAGEPLLSVPQLKGLRFRGGVTLSVELVAMILGIVLYGSAYIAEVVRGGLNEVPKGLTEAGQALGMHAWAVWFKIKMPMALRSIIPPLGNQWIFIMKATTVGVAIGFSDLFYIVSTSITQSGQTLELIFILMSAFLLVNFTIAQLVNLLNAHLALKGH